MAFYNVQPLRSKKEIAEFADVLRKGKKAKRNLFLFKLGINTGLRMSDLVNLKVMDLKYTDKPRIIEKKTGKLKTLYLYNLQKEIRSYIKDKEDNDYLFVSNKGKNTPITVNGVYQIFREVGKQLSRNDIGTHTLRKTFGYHYYNQTKDIATLMVLFQHSSENITKRYIGISADELEEKMLKFKI